MALDADRKNGPAARSFTVDAHDCIMVRIKRSYRIQVCGHEDVATGELPSDPQQTAPDAEAMQKAPVAVHLPSACSGVKALRNTSDAKAARRQAALAFRSLDPFRALREPHRRRRDEERPFPLRTKNCQQNLKNNRLTGKASCEVCGARCAPWRAPLGSSRRRLTSAIRRRSFEERPTRGSSSLRVLRRQGAAKHKRR